MQSVSSSGWDEWRVVEYHYMSESTFSHHVCARVRTCMLVRARARACVSVSVCVCVCVRACARACVRACFGWSFLASWNSLLYDHRSRRGGKEVDGGKPIKTSSTVQSTNHSRRRVWCLLAVSSLCPATHRLQSLLLNGQNPTDLKSAREFSSATNSRAKMATLGTDAQPPSL